MNRIKPRQGFQFLRFVVDQNGELSVYIPDYLRSKLEFGVENGILWYNYKQ